MLTSDASRIDQKALASTDQALIHKGLQPPQHLAIVKLLQRRARVLAHAGIAIVQQRVQQTLLENLLFCRGELGVQSTQSPGAVAAHRGLPIHLQRQQQGARSAGDAGE